MMWCECNNNMTARKCDVLDIVNLLEVHTKCCLLREFDVKLRIGGNAETAPN